MTAASKRKLRPIPASADLRQYLPPILDQGQRPTCLAFAVTAAHELARAGGFAVNEDLSEEALYWGCKRHDRDRLPGTSFVSATAALARSGQPLEAVWPYDPTHDDTISRPPPVKPGPSWHRTRLVRIKLSTDRLRAELARGRAIALGIVLTAGFRMLNGNRVPQPQAGEQTFGRHAVLSVGYQDGSPDPNAGAFIIRNSWGETWGSRGYAWLPYTYVKALGQEAWRLRL